ncbi:unnamed protein product, partial [Discosporangium mesarthrocarpum]
ARDATGTSGEVLARVSGGGKGNGNGDSKGGGLLEAVRKPESCTRWQHMNKGTGDEDICAECDDECWYMCCCSCHDPWVECIGSPTSSNDHKEGGDGQIAKGPEDDDSHSSHGVVGSPSGLVGGDTRSSRGVGVVKAINVSLPACSVREDLSFKTVNCARSPAIQSIPAGLALEADMAVRIRPGAVVEGATDQADVSGGEMEAEGERSQPTSCTTWSNTSPLDKENR